MPVSALKKLYTLAEPKLPLISENTIKMIAMQRLTRNRLTGSLMTR